MVNTYDKQERRNVRKLSSCWTPTLPAVDESPLSVVEVSLWKLRAEEFSISAD